MTHQRRRLPTLLVVVAVHGALLWAVLQATPLRAVTLEAEPLRVRLVAEQPTARSAPVALPAPPLLPAPLPLPIAVPEVAIAAPPPAPVTVAAPERRGAPTPVAAAAPAASTAMPTPSVSAPPVPAVASAPTQPSTEPKQVDAAAVRYLVKPAPRYPLASRRLRETGTVILQVLVDAAGLPRQIVLVKSSGHPLLDEAAIAAMREARFQPYSENGVALTVWAPVAPIIFEL
ncbi:energy transducer TonB [Piscinibacter sakaiensis]|uniref:energy transducer TonB n=1 Tax=Piscinibacter sakaiensis TaxID=1547922 RepID=UPI003AAAD425